MGQSILGWVFVLALSASAEGQVSFGGVVLHPGDSKADVLVRLAGKVHLERDSSDVGDSWILRSNAGEILPDRIGGITFEGGRISLLWRHHETDDRRGYGGAVDDIAMALTRLAGTGETGCAVTAGETPDHAAFVACDRHAIGILASSMGSSGFVSQIAEFWYAKRPAEFTRPHKP